MHIELQVAGDDARDVEEIVDQARLRPCVTLDDLEGAIEIRFLINVTVTDQAWPNRGSKSAGCAVRVTESPEIHPSVDRLLPPAGASRVQADSKPVRCSSTFFRAVTSSTSESTETSLPFSSRRTELYHSQ